MLAEGGRLLALTSVMPPLVYPRALQVSRLLKALQKENWHTDVVTSAPDSAPASLKDDQLARLYSGFYKTLEIPTSEDPGPTRIPLRLWRKIRGIQDYALENWRARAGRTLLRQLATNKYDAVVTFAQPWINHLIGLDVKQAKPSIFWAAHFSDPWADSPYYNTLTKEAKKEEHRLEEKVIKNADGLFFVCQRTADLVMSKYSFSHAKKVRILPHCYDQDTHRSIAIRQKRKKRKTSFRIIHTGNFYGTRSPEKFIQALALFRKNRPLDRDLIRVEFVGFFEGAIEKRVQELIRISGLGNVVRLAGPLEYAEAQSRAAEADLLLVIDAQAEESVFFPSKLADYFLLGKPILAVTPSEGSTADLAFEVGFRTAHPGRIDLISSAIARQVQLWKAGKPEGLASDATERFESRHVAKLFLRHLQAWRMKKEP